MWLSVTPAVDLNTVIQKEAIYCALGRCAHRLKKEIPFDQWLQHTLAVEAKEPANPRYDFDDPSLLPLANYYSYPIIKRRIAWLIAKWVSEDCASPDNPLIWDVLVHLLGDRSPSTDTVVRLTAATALKDCIDVCRIIPFLKSYSTMVQILDFWVLYELLTPASCNYNKTACAAARRSRNSRKQTPCRYCAQHHDRASWTSSMFDLCFELASSITCIP